ncbi:WYL domain [Phytophthora infestans]|uniref:WYL domain n=1 Tax=Phytophthora infestans TaxID=4787 RepID=A0A833WMA4_PHYIN|nr:WYL domain [Phytophthora infestans]KAF4131876.1 WYL domain [Phytophthora infestans]
MRQSFKAGYSVDDFAKYLGIADDVVGARTSSTVLQQLMRTDEYMKYATYLNFVSQQNKKKRPPLIYGS